jgi:hypothetical protein
MQPGENDPVGRVIHDKGMFSDPLAIVT